MLFPSFRKRVHCVRTLLFSPSFNFFPPSLSSLSYTTDCVTRRWMGGNWTQQMRSKRGDLCLIVKVQEDSLVREIVEIFPLRIMPTVQRFIPPLVIPSVRIYIFRDGSSSSKPTRNFWGDSFSRDKEIEEGRRRLIWIVNISVCSIFFSVYKALAIRGSI